MQENEPTHESIEEQIAGGIFTNETEQTEALRKNAEALGINPDLVAPEEGGPQIRYFPNKGCKTCYGRGIINVVISPSKKKVFWKNERKPTRVSFRQAKAARSRRIGPTKQGIKKILNVSEAYESSWDTRRKEPAGYKQDNMSQAFCRCIRAVGI